VNGLDVGLAFDLRSDFEAAAGAPDDALEEYDSVETIDAIAGALERAGHRVRRLGGGRGLVRALLDAPPELVFNMCEGWGTRSREAHVPAICEMLDVPYTHSDPLTLAASLDKDVAKRLVASAGVRTPPHIVLNGRVGDLDALDLPVVVKPLAEGSSKGIRDGECLIGDRELLGAAVARMHDDYEQPVIVEQFCPGAEITVGVLGTGPGARAIGAMEIEPLDDERLYSLEVKRAFTERVRYHVPARTYAEEAMEAAVAAHRALGCRDVSRVDLRVDADGNVAFLELNPLPGIAPGYGDLVILAERVGISHDALIGAIVAEARSR